MKAVSFVRLLLVTAVAVAGLCMTPHANAELLAHESFDYAPGELNGQTGGIGWDATNGWTADTAATELVAPPIPLAFWGVDGGTTAVNITSNSNAAISRALANPITDSFYVSFLLRWDGGTVGSTDFAGLWLGSKDNACLGVIAGQLAIRSAGNMPAANILTPTVGETYLIIGNYYKSAGSDYFDRLEVWVNPADLANPGSPLKTSAGAGAEAMRASSISTLGFRSVNLSGDSVLIDEIRIGRTFADVVPSADVASVPEPSTLAMLAAGVMGLVGFAGRKRQ